MSGNKTRRLGKTRKQVIACIRRDMVHAAGDVLSNCAVTLAYKTDVHLEDIGPDELMFICSGRVRIPRSLRHIWNPIIQKNDLSGALLMEKILTQSTG